MKACVLLSGGMDSSTLLYHCLQSGDAEAIFCDYGQRHHRELNSARDIAREADVEHTVYDLTDLAPALGGSSLTDPNMAVPEGHYQDETMKQTVVPNRNMLLLSIATAHAIANGCQRVAYAAHRGDHAIYPDCRPVFAHAMIQAMAVCSYKPIRLYVPFLNWDKGDIVAHGRKLGVPYGLTWTCYNGRSLACGKCGSCQERLEAFAKCGCEDPLEYETAHVA